MNLIASAALFVLGVGLQATAVIMFSGLAADIGRTRPEDKEAFLRDPGNQFAAWVAELSAIAAPLAMFGAGCLL